MIALELSEAHIRADVSGIRADVPGGLLPRIVIIMGGWFLISGGLRAAGWRYLAKGQEPQQVCCRARWAGHLVFGFLHSFPPYLPEDAGRGRDRDHPDGLGAWLSSASRASRQAARSDRAVNMLRMLSSQTWQAETPGALNSQHFIPCQDDGPARGAVTGSHAGDRASGASCSARQASCRSPGTPGRRRGEVIAHRSRAGTRR